MAMPFQTDETVSTQ